MTLSSSKLLSSIRSFFEPGTMPGGSTVQVVGSWMERYSSYAADALAGTLPISAPFIPRAIVSGDFIVSMDASLRTCWQTVIWAGPGQVGTASFIPSFQALFSSRSAELLQTNDRGTAASIVSDVLHRYTLGIIVLIAAPPAAPVTVPLL